MRPDQDPIFIVGSPRSGTSILTWCLGQHPNVLMLEETDFIVDFAFSSAVCWKRGSKRGDRNQLSKASISLDTFLKDVGSSLERILLNTRAGALARSRKRAKIDPSLGKKELQLERGWLDTKRRFVDGTPEYSKNLYALKKLFPRAKFIHIIRRPEDVVGSMIFFKKLSGEPFVNTQREALDYWVECVESIKVYGSFFGFEEIKTVSYDALVKSPKETITDIFEFLNESFNKNSLKALAVKLNSSRVPDDFYLRKEPEDLACWNKAEALYSFFTESRESFIQEILGKTKPPDIDFLERVDFLDGLHDEYLKCIQEIGRLNNEITSLGGWGQTLDKEIRARDAEINRLNDEVIKLGTWGQTLDKEIRARDAEINRLNDEVIKLGTWGQTLDKEIRARDAEISGSNEEQGKTYSNAIKTQVTDSNQ